MANGGLSDMLQRHGFLGDDGRLATQALLDDFLKVVSEHLSVDAEEDSTILSMEHTPELYDILIRALFVGFAHNLPVEAYVSKVATIAKTHAGIKPQALGAVFMFKARLEAEKVARRAPSMRSPRVGGGKRRAAAERQGRPLSKSSENKNQLLLMLQQAHVRAERAQERRAEYFSRKDGTSLGRRVRLARLIAKGTATRVAQRIVNALAKTCCYGPGGGLRQDPLSAMECLLLLPRAHAVGNPKGRRGNAYKSQANKKRGMQQVRERRKARKAAHKRQGRSKPLNARQRILRECAFVGVTQPKRPKKRKRTASRAQAQAEAAHRPPLKRLRRGGGERAGQAAAEESGASDGEGGRHHQEAEELQPGGGGDDTSSGARGQVPVSVHERPGGSVPVSKRLRRRHAVVYFEESEAEEELGQGGVAGGGGDHLAAESEAELGQSEAGGAGPSSAPLPPAAQAAPQRAQGSQVQRRRGTAAAPAQVATHAALRRSEAEGAGSSTGHRPPAAQAAPATRSRAAAKAPAGEEPAGEAPPPVRFEKTGRSRRTTATEPQSDVDIARFAQLGKDLKKFGRHFRLTHGRKYTQADLAPGSAAFADEVARVHVYDALVEYNALRDKFRPKV